MHGLCAALEEYPLAKGRRLVVARLGSRFFILRGERSQGLHNYEVSQPYESSGDASAIARNVMNESLMASEVEPIAFGAPHAAL